MKALENFSNGLSPWWCFTK